jgi:nucleoside-diphosphate-sugar epimerase
MRVLLIGGTGLISTGIVKHLSARPDVEITVFNRGQRENRLPPGIKHIQGDRKQFESFESGLKDSRYDVVIDMIAFHPDEAASDIRAFAGRCEQFIFCSTVCTYGVKIPPGVVVDETVPQEPISTYGKNKLACEQLLLRAHDDKKFNLTIIRPSSTYGPGGNMIDNIEFASLAWDRIERGLPVLCSGDGMGLWVSTHRDDCGKAFAFACLNSKTYGQSYNATREQNLTWRENYRQIASALGKSANVVFMPAQWIIKHDPKRFNLLAEITQFHGAYTSVKAMRDIPEFRCEIDLPNGAAQTLEDMRRRDVWRRGDNDALYQSMIDKALSVGIEPIPL